MFKPEDIEVRTVSPYGAGGMSVGTNPSQVTVSHIPSGLCITCSSERSQYANKEKALKLLALIVEQPTPQADEFARLMLQETRVPFYEPADYIPPPTPYVASRVMMIKEVREKAGCGLKEAKEAVDLMGTVKGALLHLTGSTGYCDLGVKCCCGGDLPAIREGCYNWQK